MGFLPIFKAGELLRVLLRSGFKVLRQRGSHVQLRSPANGKTIALPFHNKDIGRGLLNQIIREAGYTAKRFARLIK